MTKPTIAYEAEGKLYMLSAEGRPLRLLMPTRCRD